MAEDRSLYRVALIDTPGFAHRLRGNDYKRQVLQRSIIIGGLRRSKGCLGEAAVRTGSTAKVAAARNQPLNRDHQFPETWDGGFLHLR